VFPLPDRQSSFLLFPFPAQRGLRLKKERTYFFTFFLDDMMVETNRLPALANIFFFPFFSPPLHAIGG